MNCFQKSYLWLLNTTHYLCAILRSQLWIAFKNLIFDYWTQPPSFSLLERNRLWIAFKNLIFDYWTQPGFFSRISILCCELLSKILSLTIEHNAEILLLYEREWVVNCFQKSYLWLLNTTPTASTRLYEWLWIAFKNLIFDYWTQQIVKLDKDEEVVNCFQKSYLWLLNTTDGCVVAVNQVLWIAFKNLIFDYWTQPKCRGYSTITGCELLSKILSLTI